MFKGSTILISGGTGSFGEAAVNRFLKTDIAEIRIFSRDELKQEQLRKKYKSSKLKFFIGDVRDYSSILSATQGVDFVFHAAALKQVPSCEFFPIEAVKTNILGTENILEASFRNGVSRIVCLSTDKAVYPINAMGISKAMMEKIVSAKLRSKSINDTMVCCTRYGNVMASRGSVIPLFVKQIQSGKPLTITNLQMTRFMMTLDDSLDLILHAFKNGGNGEIFVKKSASATISILVEAIKELLDKPDHPIEIIGTRHGEKIFEVLCSREEMALAEDMGDFYKIPMDTRDLNYDKYVKLGSSTLSESQDYNSHNCQKLNLQQMKQMLLKTNYFKKVFQT